MIARVNYTAIQSKKMGKSPQGLLAKAGNLAGRIVRTGASLAGKAAHAVAGLAGEAVQGAAKGVAQTTVDAARWSSKRIFNKSLEIGVWVFKVVAIGYVAVAILTAAGAAISPGLTGNAVAKMAEAFGAQSCPTMAEAQTIGDALTIQSSCTGELIGKLMGKAVDLAAKMTTHTVKAGYHYVAKPLVAGFAGVLASGVSSAWQSTLGFFRLG